MGLCEEEAAAKLGNQPSFESPLSTAAAAAAIGREVDSLKLEEQPAAVYFDVNSSEGVHYPLRPTEPDCAYYLRTGWCKFGSFCRFNHPQEKRVIQERTRNSLAMFQVVKEMDKGSIKPIDQICKFYMMPGGCKFGETCRYSHSHERAESVPVELSTLGLPLRPGERECPYYMRTGICKYYSSCKFNHPEPSGYAGPHVIGYQNGVWQSYIPAMSFSQWLNIYMDSSRYQDSLSLLPLSKGTSFHVSTVNKNAHSIALSALNPTKATTNENAIEARELESQTEEKFINLKACIPNQVKSESPACNLSPSGLPLRPDQPVCIFYKRFGICKFGPACRFDHPMDCNLVQSSTPMKISGSTEELKLEDNDTPISRPA